ncbi:MAG: helix-turn-helix domain-containing protein, partial [Planctomycetota bacterium]
ELQNYVERAVVMAPGDELTHELLPPAVRGELNGVGPTFRRFDFESLATELVREGLSTADDKSDDLHSRVVDRVEKEVIAQVLTKCDGVQIKAAQRLGINRNTLHKKIKDYGLEGPPANGKSA